MRPLSLSAWLMESKVGQAFQPAFLCAGWKACATLEQKRTCAVRTERASLPGNRNRVPGCAGVWRVLWCESVVFLEGYIIVSGGAS
jgi:hypothetical protein